LRDDRVAGQVDDQLVEGFVRAKVGQLVDELAVLDRLDRALERAAKRSACVRPDPPDRGLDGIDLERRARVVGLPHQPRRERPPAVAARRARGHQPLAHEPRERVVHRTPRHAELVGERLEAELLAGAEVAREQPLAYPLICLLVEVDAHERRRPDWAPIGERGPRLHDGGEPITRHGVGTSKSAGGAGPPGSSTPASRACSGATTLKSNPPYPSAIARSKVAAATSSAGVRTPSEPESSPMRPMSFFISSSEKRRR